jgi:hypothetical protein
MINTCPHCAKDFNFSTGQLEKIEAALGSLKGGTLKLKCPRCFEPVELLSDGSLADWRLAGAMAGKCRSGPEPPAPPDISWLTKGTFREDERIKDIAKALVLIEPGELRAKVMGALVESFYQPVSVDTVEEAMAQLRMVQYDSVVLHSRFAGGKLRKSEIHDYMMRMPMAQRRYMFYILVGPEFHTLYTLEALANSANLVVNDRDVDHFKNLYKRGKVDYEELFGPYISVLKAVGSL